MADPTIPILHLANDESAMGIDTGDTYGLHLEIDAPDPWRYVPVGRFPDFTPQVVISMLVDDTAEAVSASPTDADNIEFAPSTGISMSDGTYDRATRTYSRAASITSDTDDVVIGPDTPLVIGMSKITPNNVAGAAKITLTPCMKAQPGTGKRDISGTALVYTVDKTQPPIVIKDVKWSLDAAPGSGTLSWTANGDVRSCTVGADGEPIGQDHYSSADSAYSASLILESGAQFVTITVYDANNNSATCSKEFKFDDFNPYFGLRVSNGRPLSLVPSDQTSLLYGVFEDSQSKARIWQNDQSGTQDNWQNTNLALPSGAETTRCVYYDSCFFLVGGSMFDPAGFGRHFQIYDNNRWHTIEAPAAWNEPRIGQGVTLFKEEIWVAGGYGASGTVYDDVYSYSRNNNVGTWTPQPALPQPLCNASLDAVGSDLYVYGGYVDMPGGNAVTNLYLLTGSAWVDQDKSTPSGAPDYWTLGAVSNELLLLASFAGTAFTGQLTPAPHWQGGDANLSNVVLRPPSLPPYGFTTASFKERLFIVMTDTENRSAFAYYEPPDPDKRASRI